MSPANRSRRWLRSAAALLWGFLVVVVLSLGTDALLHVTGVYPPLGTTMSDALLLLATLYRASYSILGSYVTARTAPSHPMQHALAGGLIGLILSVAGAVATWNKVPGPHWYPLALVVSALPCAWAGGRLRVLQMRSLGAQFEF